MAIQWGLAQQPNAFDRYFAQGQQMGQAVAQRQQRDALADYATNPNEQSLNGLASYAPEFVIGERQRLQQQQAQSAERGLIQQGAQGNSDAILQLWGVNPEMAARLDTREREHAAQGLTYMSQASLAIDAMPEEQRAAAWSDAINRGVQMGFDDLAEFGQYSPQSLQAVVARAGQMGTLVNNRQPSIFSVQPGGTAFGRDAGGNIFPVIVPNYGGAPAGSPAGGGYGQAPANVPSGSPLSQPPPQQQSPQSPIFPVAQWGAYQRAVGTALPAIVERDHPVIVNTQGVQVQTDVINGQIAYRVNGVWYDNPEGQ